MKNKFSIISIFVLSMLIPACGNASEKDESNPFGTSPDSVYKNDSSWVIKEDNENNATDTFFICPTCTSGDEGMYNLQINDENRRSYFEGNALMEKQLYAESTRFFAPYYEQALLQVYSLEKSAQEQYLSKAYESVKEAFNYYMENYNGGNAIILAGFSQGADMCLRLLKDYFTTEAMAKKLVACYAIGWIVSDDYLAQSEYLKAATGETDTGVIVSFNSEAAEVTSSFVVGENEHSNCINPINWKTDGTVATKEENLGTCFYSTRGYIKSEESHLCGCYVEPKRGVLKVTDIASEDYPNKLAFSKDGVYHTYDYQFFYKNIQQNVFKRIISYYSK